MAAPSLLDRLIGNMPMFLLLCGAFLVNLYLWYEGSASSKLWPFVLGFIALMSRASRERLLAEARWEEEKAATLGKPRPGVTVLQGIMLAPLWLLLIVSAYLFFASHTGFDGAGEAVRVADGIAAVLGHPLTSIAMGGVVIVLAGVAVRRVVVRFAGSKGKGVAAVSRKAGKGWEGTVRVMLPVPKDDR